MDDPGLQAQAPTTPRRQRIHPEIAGAQVFARDTRLPPEAPLIYLADGEAGAVRADTRAGFLLCPIDGCEDPRFVARGGTRRRHHFAHHRGAGRHAPETIAHHTAKHLIAAWLRAQHPHAQVYPDTKDVENGQRPDVLLVLPGGRQIAYEVQFAHLTPQQWQARHDGYQTQGIRDVWLFGGRRYDRPPRGHHLPNEVALHTVMPAVLATRHPMLVIDPTTQTVALGTGPGVTEHLTAAGYQPRDTWRTATLDRRWPLDALRAPGGVIDVPGTRDLLTTTAAAHGQWIKDVQRRLEQQAEAARQAQIIDKAKAEVAALRGESKAANAVPQRAGGSATGAARIARWDANRTLRRMTAQPPTPPTASPRPTASATYQPQLFATPHTRPQQPDLQRTLAATRS